MSTKTKSQEMAADVSALLRARNPLIWVVTREEARVERYIFEAAAAASYTTRTWDVGLGVCDINGNKSPMGDVDPGDTLKVIRDRALSSTNKERCVWIMRDLPVWMDGAPGASVLRQLRNLARLLPSTPRENAQAILVISPNGNVPAELSGHATVLDWPLPDRDEIAAILEAALNALPPEIKAKAATNGTKDAAVDAAVGLSGEEAQACIAKSLVQLRKIDPVTVAKEKKRVVARERVLEWYDPIPGGLEAVGGLENLKAWLVSRTAAYSPAAREYGLPAPKGAMLVGVSGCGKSLTAKAIATAYGVPLLRLDLGALKSKFVGDSEQNLRKAFRVIEAIGRCVVWLDEVEKALQGAISSSADGGVSSDALGTILSWMQERSGDAFVVATANNIEGLPPEFLRKGRFDEIWFVDLPNHTERQAVVKAAMKNFKREAVKVDFNKIAAATEGFTGAELAAIVPDALFTAFADKAREVTTSDILAAAKTVVPLSKTAGDKIDKLREWAKTRTRPATAVEAPAKTSAKSSGRDLDLN